MGEYSKAAVIKYTRKAVGMTQEELSEGICEPVTLSRYENGQLNPSDDKFVRLMQKMGESGETCLFPLYCEDVRLQQEMENMLYAIEEKNWCKVEKLKQKIETEFHLSKDYSENRQYLKRIETITRYRKKEINVQEAIEELRTALNETLGNIEPENFPVGKILRETEILVIYNLASYYAEAGNAPKALVIYERLDEYFSRKDTVYVFLYNIGWNIYEKIKQGLEKKDRLQEAKCYVWTAYQLCSLYPENKKNLKVIINYFNDMN